MTTGLSNKSFTGTPASGGFTATGVQPITYTNFEVRKESGSASGGTLDLSSATYTVAEGAGTATITIDRTGTLLGTVGVTVTPSNGTAIGPSDFDPTPRTVSFAEGQTTATVQIPILDDPVDEPGETVTITLSNPNGGATLGTLTTATLTIQDDDGASSLSVAPAQQTEGNGAPPNVLTFAVTLSTASGQP